MRTLGSATPWLFLVFALATSLFLAWNLPPFMAADELTHLQRSDMLTFGPAGEGRAPRTGYRTGEVDAGLAAAAVRLDPVRGHSEAKVRRADLEAMLAGRFDGRTVEIYQSNARNPVFYLPGAAAVALGKLMDLRVVTTLYLARGLNAVTAILVAFAGLLLARQARLPLFAILTLPMAAALFGSVNQDAQILGMTALAVGLLSRAMAEGRPVTTSESVALTAAFAMVGMAKLPYALLSLLMWAAPAENRRIKWAMALLALALPLAWTLWLARDAWPPGLGAATPPDPDAQARLLLEHPGAVAAIGLATLQVLGDDYWREFVGVLGWLDTLLPAGFYLAAAVALAAAFVSAAAPWGGATAWRRVRATAPALAVLAAAAVFAAMYLTWSPVGSPIVEGVQGRYLLPLALVCTLALEGPRSWLDGGRARRGLQTALTAVVLAFPLVGWLVTARAVLLRYYLG